MDFGQILTVLSILGGVALLLLKIGAKDEQFRNMLTEVRRIADKQNGHSAEFAQLSTIVNGMLQMQKVSDGDRERIKGEIETIFRRLKVLEDRKHKAVTES